MRTTAKIAQLFSLIYLVLLILYVWSEVDPMGEARLYRFLYLACQRTAYVIGRVGLWAENEYRITVGA